MNEHRSPQAAEFQTSLLLKSISTTAGQTIELGRVTVLVGPNNSGKSACLRDIYRLATTHYSQAETNTGVTAAVSTAESLAGCLSQLRFQVARSPEQFQAGLQVQPQPDSLTTIQGLHADLQGAHKVALRKEAWRIMSRPDLTSDVVQGSELANLMPLRFAFPALPSRSSLVNSAPANSPLAAPANLLQLLQAAPAEIHQTLSELCRQMFGVEVRLDSSERVQLTLRVGKSIPLEPADPVSAARMYAACERLDDQGEGMRHVMAIALAILLLPGRTILLEFPESGLHLDQRLQFGGWLAHQASIRSVQLVMTTHDPELLEGLSVADPGIVVVRFFNRRDGRRLTTIPGNVLTTIATSPQLAGQRPLECIFRDGIVIAKDDVDRAVFQAVARHTLHDSRASFLYCRGHRANDLLRLFRSANLASCAILDLRAFDTANSFAEIVEVATGTAPPRGWLRIRQKLADIVEGRLDSDQMAESTMDFENFLAQWKQGSADPSTLSNRELRRLRAERWSAFVAEGQAALPRELRLWVQELVDELKQFGVFVAMRGKTQNWFAPTDPQAGTKGDQDWFHDALTKLRNGQCPMDLQVVVSEALEYLQLSRVQLSTDATRPARLSHRT